MKNKSTFNYTSLGASIAIDAGIGTAIGSGSGQMGFWTAEGIAFGAAFMLAWNGIKFKKQPDINEDG